MESRELKLKYENGRFIPLSSIDLKDGAIIEIEIIPEGKNFSWRGALKNIKLSSTELQHKIKEIW